MAIRSITLAEFEQFKPARSPMIALIATEKAWFTDSASNVLGVLLYDKGDHDWNYVILGRDERDSFRAIDTESSIASQAEAERRLVAKLAKLEAAGDRVFPQGD